MASILKIGLHWRAQVRRKGHPKMTQTFTTEAAAHEWAQGIESEMDEGTFSGKHARLAILVDRYLRDEPDMGTCKADALKQIKAGLGHVEVSTLRVSDVTGYVASRGYGPSTAQAEMSALNMLLKVSRILWGYDVPDIMDDVKDYLRLKGCYKKSKERDRRPTVDELHRICDWFDANSSLPMRDLIWFSIHSTMRAGEVTRIKWKDYDSIGKTVIIRDRKDPKKKIGNDQEVPLLGEAIEIIERQSRQSECIFPYNSHTFSTLFPRACHALGIEDLRWHDLRHEGTSRLFERGYIIPEVVLFTGHKDWAMLRRYTHLKARNLRHLPGTAAPVSAPVLTEPADALEPVRSSEAAPTSIKQAVPARVKVKAGPGKKVAKVSDSKLAPGVVVEYVDKRSVRFGRGKGLIVGISNCSPPRYTLRVCEGTKHEHTRRVYSSQIVGVQAIV